MTNYDEESGIAKVWLSPWVGDLKAENGLLSEGHPNGLA